MTRLIVPESEDEFDNINLDGVVIDKFELNYAMFQDVLAHRTPVKTESQNNWALNAFTRSKCMFLFQNYVYFLFTLALSLMFLSGVYYCALRGGARQYLCD